MNHSTSLSLSLSDKRVKREFLVTLPFFITLPPTKQALEGLGVINSISAFVKAYICQAKSY